MQSAASTESFSALLDSLMEIMPLEEMKVLKNEKDVYDYLLEVNLLTIRSQASMFNFFPEERKSYCRIS